MTATFEENEIRNGPLTILQILARQVENDGDNKVLVRELMSETDLSRGSVHNYLTGTLEPNGLVTTTGTKSTPGAAEDANFWGVTQTGYDWVASLGPNELAPVEASGQAFETARKAREIASNARSTAEDADDQVTSLDGKVENHVDDLDERISSLNDDTEKLRSTLEDIRSSSADRNDELAEDLNDLVDEIDNIDERVNNINDFAAETRELANKNKTSLVGSETDTGLINDVSVLENSLNQLQRYTIGTGAIAFLALLFAVLALLI